MVTITTTDASQAYATECIAFLLEEHFDTKQLQQVTTTYAPFLTDLMQQADFTAKEKSIFVLPIAHLKPIVTLIFIGIGKKNKTGIIPIETLRRAFGTLIKTMQNRHLGSATLHLPVPATYGFLLII